MKISAILLVGEYEPYLEYCIKSIENIVDEIIMVKKKEGNTGVITKLKPVILEIPQKCKKVDFAKWRNQALNRCNGEYILRIDADEIIAHPDGGKLTRFDMEHLCNIIKKENVPSISLFTYHFLYNYFTIDGRNNGWHFTKHVLFKNIRRAARLKWLLADFLFKNPLNSSRFS